MKKALTVALCFVLALQLFGCSCSGAGGSSSSETLFNTVPASDYSNEQNWLNLPREPAFEADVLYFYPTRYAPESEDDPRICSIDNASMREGAQVNLMDQASVFETCANIYAPYYRQVDATSLAGLTQTEIIEVESGEPRADVFAALDYYFQHYNEGKPFFLAGHSQGSMMVYLILDEYLEQHPEYYERMVAAYMIGNAATLTWLDENPHVKMAQGADDTGVLVSWNTEGPANAGSYNMVAPEGSVCINPLNWKTDATPATVDENRGTLTVDETGNYYVGAGIADATIDLERGTVICSSVDPAMYAMPASTVALFGPESYHGWDYKFYYQNIRENAELRLAIFLSN